MQRVYRFLDSQFLSRVGNAETLVNIVGLGLAILVAVGLIASGVVDVAGWIPIACFAVWSVLALGYLAAWATRRQPSTIASPLARVVIGKGLPRSSQTLMTALANAESRVRDLISEAAVLMPVNNHRAAALLGAACEAFEAEVSALLRRQDELDERWLLLWERQPSWVGQRLFRPLTGADLDVLVKYMALHARQLGWMLDSLQGGGDEPVRHIRAWIAAEQRLAA